MTILLGLKYFSKIALYFYAQKYLTYINTTLPSDRQTHALISAILHTGEPKDGIITRRINMVQRESCGDLFLIKKQIINQSLWQQVKIMLFLNPKRHCFLLPKEYYILSKQKQNERLSNCNRILIFRSEFPVLPRKISAYLRTDSPSERKYAENKRFL